MNALRTTAASLLLAALGSSMGAGCNKNSDAAEKRTPPPSCATCVVADERGFTPSRIDLKAGAKGETREVTFTRTSDDTCARDVVFPELGIKQPLPLNQPVVLKLPADTARTLNFQCGMGMYKSSVVVTSS